VGTLFKAKKRFSDWAASLEGFDGGNIRGPIWFCGIEFGVGPEALKRTSILGKRQYYYKVGDMAVPCWDDRHIEWATESGAIKRWPFNRKITRVACSYLGDKTPPAAYMRNELFRQDGQTFKLNLYPLRFANIRSDWTPEHKKVTGLPNKLVYQAWCMEHRFPVLKSLVHRFRPRVLICTGNTHRGDFMDAFHPEGRFGEVDKYRIAGSNRHRSVVGFWLNDGSTLVLITPFFGQGGLMSTKSLESLGRLARRVAPSE